MKTNQNTTLLAIILIATLAISSCKKETHLPQTKKKTTDVKWVDATYNDMWKFAMAVNSGSFKNEEGNALLSCATITDDTVSMPHTRTLDYGTGCMDDQGKVHKGQIVLSYNNRDFLHVSGAYVDVALNNYFVDSNQLTGSVHLQNTGINGNGNISLTLDVNAQRILANSGGTDSVGGQEVVEWVAGANTSENVDDQFSYTGGANAHMANGDVGSVTILQPLIKNRAPGCNEYFVKGETLTQVSGQSDRYLDYGDGTCDAIAVETVDGNATEIHLD
jgi:hypothetical protein